MTILGLEFSSECRGVALLRDGRILAETSQNEGRHTRAIGMIDAVLRQAGIARGELDAIAVGLGPGSYTGVRLAISVAQGWQLTTGIRVAGVGSMAALAAGLGVKERVMLAVDAQRSEYAVSAAEAGALIEPIRLEPLLQLRSRLDSGQRVYGPGIQAKVGGMDAFPQAAVVAQLAVETDAWVAAELLAPVYLREVAFVKAPPARIFPVVRHDGDGPRGPVAQFPESASLE